MNKNIRNKLIDLFDLFGYELIEEREDGRWILFDTLYETKIQFFTHIEEPIKRATKLISDIIYKRGFNRGQETIREQFRELMGA